MKKIITTALCAIMLLTMLSTFTVSYAADYYVYMTGDVNVRSGPGLNYSILGSIYAGSTYTSTGEYHCDNRGVIWYEICYGYGWGWVSSRYASLTGDCGYYDYDYGYDDYTSFYGGTACYIVGVYGDSNVRTGPGLDYSSIGVLDEGETATYTGTDCFDDRGVIWHEIYFGGRTAWVSSRYTEKQG